MWSFISLTPNFLHKFIKKDSRLSLSFKLQISFLKTKNEKCFLKLWCLKLKWIDTEVILLEKLLD